MEGTDTNPQPTKMLLQYSFMCCFLFIQALDLRWGVQGSGMYTDPQTTKLMQQYITECQAMSLGPNIAVSTVKN